jgi:DNA-binding NarL/FixJ family response regulator
MGKLVFFVDDDIMILNLIEYTIKNKLDFEIQTYLSGEECIENLKKKPDLIVLDYIFKGNGILSGLETLREIRKDYLDIPVFILTSQEDNKTENVFMDNGATLFIPKNDYFIDALLESIEKEIF